jgi:hypothetical protein
MNMDEHLLAASIRDTIRKAESAVSRVFHLTAVDTVRPGHEGYHAMDVDAARSTLRFLVEKVFRDTGILAERMGLPRCRGDLMAKLRSFEDLAVLEETPWDVGPHSAPLAAARVMYDSLAIMTEGREVTGLGVFETILESTPKIIQRAKLMPENEGQVREQIREVLGYAFRDVVREVPIPKNIKTYHPDIGVRSLMAAAEYKFIDKEAEAKAALDGIYADMHGYAGHSDWRSFYAVFYMTAPFYTQKDVEQEFRLVKAELSWTSMVLVGPGERKVKQKRAQR